jgi:hypothetical protein
MLIPGKPEGVTNIREESPETGAAADHRPARRRPSRTRRDATTRSDSPRSGSRIATAAFAGGLSRLVLLAAWTVAGIIAAGILLVVLNANPTNDIVNAVHDAARWLVGPFDGMFTLDSTDATIAVNWGIAALVYLILGGIVARIIAMARVVGTGRRRTFA